MNFLLVVMYVELPVTMLSEGLFTVMIYALENGDKSRIIANETSGGSNDCKVIRVSLL